MKPEVYPVAFAPRKSENHWMPGTVTWDDIQGWMEKPAKRKDTDGYILATLAKRQKIHPKSSVPCDGDFHRDTQSVTRRSAIVALDVDHPEEGFETAVELLLDGHAYILHTTFSSTPEAPRFRLLVPVDRDMSQEEYICAMRTISFRLGEEQFDRSTFDVARFMYKPASRDPKNFEFWVADGDPMPVDDLIVDLDLELSHKPMPKPNRKKRDPYSIEGPVGSFNRVYEDWDELIEKFELPYEKDGDRYRLVGASSEAGMGPISDSGFVYSHHQNDPAWDQTCSAFDLVRVHWFGELDDASKAGTPFNKLPSYLEMLDVARADEKVVAETFQSIVADFSEEADEEDGDWRLGLKISRQGKCIVNMHNWDILRKNDPVFLALRMNEMTLAVEFEVGEVPWREVTNETRPLRKSDRTELHDYLVRTYAFEPTKEALGDRVDAVAQRHTYNPVLDYLSGLVWDGVSRLETCLPGVRPTDYTRWVARKVLVAAVSRVFEPGCFWDHTLVLYGDEGIGKSKWISRMARGYSGSLPTRIDNTDSLRIMHRSWIVISDEGHTMKKTDFEALKEFLTRTEDSFRLPYERDFFDGKRKSVIWSTTNDETFLRREVGNRRFLVVNCEDKVDFDALTDDYIDQVWAETVAIYRLQEEDLFLTPEQAEQAVLERERFTEEDVLAGVVREYLSRQVPADWELMTRVARAHWMQDREFHEAGTELINRVCSAEVLEVALGKRIGEDKPGELTRITNALKRMLDWEQQGVSANSGGYGPQLMFTRKDNLL